MASSSTEQTAKTPKASKSSKQSSSEKGVSAAAAGTVDAESNGRGLSKIQEGIVTSNKMQKTVVVSIVSYKKHPQYGKYVRRTKKYMAHDERSECQIGDRVQIVETRPLSKLKRWRVQKIVERAV